MVVSCCGQLLLRALSKEIVLRIQQKTQWLTWKMIRSRKISSLSPKGEVESRRKAKGRVRGLKMGTRAITDNREWKGKSKIVLRVGPMFSKGCLCSIRKKAIHSVSIPEYIWVWLVPSFCWRRGFKNTERRTSQNGSKKKGFLRWALCTCVKLVVHVNLTTTWSSVQQSLLNSRQQGGALTLERQHDFSNHSKNVHLFSPLASLACQLYSRQVFPSYTSTGLRI